MVRPRVASVRPDRRTVLLAAGLMLAAGMPLRAAMPQPRLAAIDWAMLETAIALGHMPVAACELIRFRADAGDLGLPEGVVDLGLRGAPNFELLQLTRPDLILTSPYYTQYEDRLARLAPVLNLPFFTAGQPPLPKAFDALFKLAGTIGDDAAAPRAADAANALLDRTARQLAPFADRPVCLVDIGDARHMRIFGFDSLFGSTLSRLGMANGWSEATAFSFMAPVPIEALARMGEARLVIVGAPPPEAARGLRSSVLWRALPQVSGRRVHLLPEVNPFGAVPSALRFAGLLSQALRAPPADSI